MKKIHEIFGTRNRKEQAQIAEDLIQMARTPVIDVIIRYDLRKVEPLANIMAVGGEPLPTPVEILHILDRARDMVMKNIIASSGQQEMPSGEPPQHPPQPAEDTGEPSPETNAPEVAVE
jgi:hypothetical protein